MDAHARSVRARLDRRAGRPRYVVTHAPGATRFAHERDSIATELTLAVPRSDAVKISRLRITNRDSTTRRLSLTSYVEWVLGAQREHTRHQLHTRHDPRRARCSRRISSPRISPPASRSRGSARRPRATRRDAITSSAATET